MIHDSRDCFPFDQKRVQSKLARLQLGILRSITGSFRGKECSLVSKSYSRLFDILGYCSVYYICCTAV